MEEANSPGFRALFNDSIATSTMVSPTAPDVYQVEGKNQQRIVSIHSIYCLPSYPLLHTLPRSPSLSYPLTHSPPSSLISSLLLSHPLSLSHPYSSDVPHVPQIDPLSSMHMPAFSFQSFVDPLFRPFRPTDHQEPSLPPSVHLSDEDGQGKGRGRGVGMELSDPTVPPHKRLVVIKVTTFSGKYQPLTTTLMIIHSLPPSLLWSFLPSLYV